MTSQDKLQAITTIDPNKHHPIERKVLRECQVIAENLLLKEIERKKAWGKAPTLDTDDPL